VTLERSRVRAIVAVPAVAALGALLIWALVGVPGFGDYRGPYGYVLNRIAVPQRHTTNVVTSIVFDYRGFDTMGEEFILFGAVLGVVLLLRAHGEDESGENEADDVVDAVSSDALRLVGGLAAGVALLIGIWLIAFGFVTPGGGFQGGVVVAGAVLLVYVAGSYRSWRKVSNEDVLDPVEGIGVGGYAVVGLAALVSGLPFLHNLLGPGQSGTLFSGGSLPFLNLATALEVAAANVVLCSQFLEQYVAPLARGKRARE
jgi:multicomponent Na+:H+ antiporter subunit B